jgi:hypothetical protein
MESFLDLKNHLVVVEVECSLLLNLALNLCKGEQSMASNQRMSSNSSKGEYKGEYKGEEIMNQFDDEMIIVN